MIAEYQDATDENLVNFVKNSVASRGANKGRFNLNPASERAVRDIKELTGVDATGFKTVMEQRIAEHIYDEHGPDGTTDQSMRDLNDVGRLQYVLDHYDSVVHGGRSGAYTTVKPNGKTGQAQTVVFSKAVNGTYYTVVAAPDTKAKTLFVVSAYMKKSDNNKVTGTPRPADASAPAYTSNYETANAESAAVPVATTVTQAASGVKAEAERPAARQVYDGLRLENAGAAFGENGAKALWAAYGETRGEVSASDYYGGFAQYYHAGLTGAKPERVRSDYADVLTQAQKFAAYTAGQNDAAASLAQEQQAARFASTAGKESGLVYDAFVQEAIASGRQQPDSNGETRTYLTAETAETLNQTAKALGVRVRFVDSVAAGKANAQIRGSEVLVERNNPNPVRFLLGHEFTHRMQELAPREYRVFRDAVLQGKEQLVQARIDSYGRQGVELDYESAMDEVAADYAGLMMDDGEMLDRFVAAHKENRTLLEKVRDVFRQLAAKLTGAEKRKAQTAAGKLEAALEAAAAQNRKLENAKTGKKKGTAGEGGEVRFSVKQVDGKDVVWLENSSLTSRELNDHKAVAEYIAQHIGEVYTIIESGQRVYIGKDLPGEYTHSAYTNSLRKRNPQALKAKNKATSELGLLIETATNRRWEKTKHPHSKDAKYGMYRYDISIAFPVKAVDGTSIDVRAYDAELLIRNASDGKKYLYDVVNMKRNTADAIDLQQRETRLAAYKDAASHGDASIDSVRLKTENVNGKFSMKLSPDDILTVQSIGRKSVNEFDSKDIATTEKFARMYWNEMGEKSPFFRSWFGDWRVNDPTPVQIATQRGDARGVQVNDDTGWSIQVSGKVFNETKGHRSAASTTARPYLPYINDIIKKAVLLDSCALDRGKEKSVNSLLMHSMYAVADIGNGREILKLYVEEMNDPNKQDTGKRAYQLQNIERQQSGAVGSGASPSLVTRTAGSLTVADIFSTVKRLDKNFRPNPESKIVDAEGKPLVMYHGTRAENGEFTVFDYSKAAKKGGLGLKALGKGNYFTSEKLDGSERYGSRVIPAYLDIKKPFIFRGGQSLNEQVEQETGIRTQGMDTAALQDAMREQGYDGVVQYQKDGTIGVAVTFDSNQIKSAVDNIGTFDRANPDIRFSLKQDGTEDAETILRGAGGRGTMGGKQDSRSGKYWKPKLSRREWSLLNRKLEQGLGEDSHFLDEATKWTYADERGDKVFALYGIGDGTEATPLYAVGGKEATAAYERLLPQLEDLQDGFDGNKKDVNQWIASVRSNKRNGRSYLNAPERSGATAGRTDRLHDGTSERNTKRASGADTGDYTRESGERGSGDGGDGPYSLKAGTVNKRAAALAEENRMLREQLGDYKAMLRENGRLRESRDHWKKQTQRSKAVSTDEKAVAAAAKKLVQDYGAQVDTKQVQAQLQGLYDFIARGHDGKNELSGEAAYRRAEAIATDIVENAVTQDREMFDLYSGLRDYLKNTKIAFGKEYQSEIGDYQDFRRGLLGKVRLHQDGTPIDQVYTEMAELWPEFFDEQEQSRTCRIFLFGDCKRGDFVLYCFCVSVCEIQADKSLNSLERGYANSGNRPRYCNRWIWCFGCGAGTAVSGSLRCYYDKSGFVSVLPSGADLCGYAGTDLHLFPPGNGGRGAVLFQQHHDRNTGRPWPRCGAAGRVSGRAAHCGVYAHAGQAGCCGIWQGGKAPGHGYGASTAAFAGCPKTG